METVSGPAQRIHAVLDVVRYFILEPHFDEYIRQQTAQGRPDLSLHSLSSRADGVSRCDGLHTIEVVSLALSALRMLVQRFLGKAVVAEKLCLLRATEGESAIYNSC